MKKLTQAQVARMNKVYQETGNLNEVRRITKRGWSTIYKYVTIVPEERVDRSFRLFSIWMLLLMVGVLGALALFLNK